MLVLLFVLQNFYLRTSRQMRLLDLEAKSPLYSHFISSFSGLTALRAYGWSSLAAEENLYRLNESQRPFYLLRCVMRWLTMVLNLIVAGLAVLLVGISVALKDSINPGLLGVALTSVMGIGQTLSQLIQSWTQVEISLGAVTRIDQFAAETPREPDGPDMPPTNWPSKGAIHISGLYAKYGDHTVLTDINLDIQPGQKIAVCGRSGSGKSTLITLLLRLYEPTAGKDSHRRDRYVDAQPQRTPRSAGGAAAGSHVPRRHDPLQSGSAVQGTRRGDPGRPREDGDQGGD